MSFSAGSVCRYGGLELLLSFGNQALREILVALAGVLCGLFRWRQGGQAHGTHLIELKGSLPEGGL